MSDTLKRRVFFMARDGMTITLYSLLSDTPPHEVNRLLNDVRTHSFVC